MAVTSKRWPTIFKGGGYWRCEMSWRTNGDTDQFFSTDWTTGIVDASECWWDFDKIAVKAKNEAEILSVDTVSFEFQMTADVVSALDASANSDTDIRLWWSANGSTGWTPIFWGNVDYDDLNSETQAIVGGTYIKTITIQAYDCIVRLKEHFTKLSYAQTSKTSYQITRANAKVGIGAATFADLFGAHGTNFLALLPSNDFLSIMYYIVEPAKLIFGEHNHQTLTTSPVCYGLHPSTDVGCAVTFHAATTSTSTYTTVENTFDKVYVLDDWDTTEFIDDWESWADAVAEMCFQLGFCVRTRHSLESGIWVRQLNYLRLDGDNNATIVAQGLLTKRNGMLAGRRIMRNWQVTTRFFQGGAKINDFLLGRSGEVKNAALHFHTMGAGYGTFGLNIDPNNLTADWARNIVWNALFIEDPSDATMLRVVTNVEVDTPSGRYAFPLTGHNEAWKDTVVSYNGYAEALANYYTDMITPVGVSTIEEERSDIRAYEANRATTTPGNWSPMAQIADDELAGTFRVLSVVVDPSGALTIRKEKI